VAKKKFSGMSTGEDLPRPFDNPWDEFRQQEKDFVTNDNQNDGLIDIWHECLAS